MAFIDYYKILGVDKNIPQDDVREATANAPSNSIPTCILTTRRQRLNSRL